MVLKFKQQIIEDIQKVLTKLNINEVALLETPKDRNMGDYAIPCFVYAKVLRKNPNEIAQLLSEHLESDIITKKEVIGGYLNLFLERKKIIPLVINEIINKNEHYGDLAIGCDKTIVIDYSAPNIAKPFGVGHLRSTVIGNAIRQILDKLGYQTIGINYLGDYGTQFGKLIYAYKTWGNEAKIKKDPISELNKLYVRFHEEAKLDPSLEDKGREYFKRLEDKDPEVLKLWQWLRDESLKSFMKTYELLGITNFDSFEGEASVEDKIAPTIAELEKRGLLEEDEGAKIVRLGDDIAPALIVRNDGASLYMTRELASIFDRKARYDFDKILYVVGNEQTLHFMQLKRLIKKMGYDWADNIHHISFGLILQDGKKMSTRYGKIVELNQLLEESINLAESYIIEKNPNLANKDEISRIVGVGAIIFNDLKNYRTSDVEFNLKDILKFEGETAPYIQYTYARINSMLDNLKDIDTNINHLNISEYIWNIIMKLLVFEEILINSHIHYDPSILAKYIIDLAQDYNKFYGNEKIISDNIEDTQFKLRISKATSIVLKEGMRILGIAMPSKM